jgi:hypothetical protein
MSTTKEETMNRAKRTRARLSVLLAAALGALGLLALPGLAASKDSGGHHRSHQGQKQARNAGTIASFDAQTGRLTIDLFGTDSVSGLVNDRTRIKCEDEHSPDVSERNADEPGEDRGHHGGESGDDDGHHGEDEPGEDHHGDNSGPGSSNSGPSGHDDNGTGANCTTSDLIVGAIVQEAELEIKHGRATFEEVELAD